MAGSSQRGPRRVQYALLGRVPYAEGVVLQDELRAGLLAGREPESLLLLEHPHVYTLGRNARPEDVLLDGEAAATRRVEVHHSDRGGQVTYHGPGQLVGYPILDLDPDRRDVRRYIRDLQEVLVRTVADFSVVAHAAREPERIGIWAGERKLASIGVHLRRWVTTHGFALNVSTDLGYFEGIVPCGLRGVGMTSLESLTGTRVRLEEVARRLLFHFGRIFERTVEPVSGRTALGRWVAGRDAGRDASAPTRGASDRFRDPILSRQRFAE